MVLLLPHSKFVGVSILGSGFAKSDSAGQYRD